jgi:hypothetical protein
VRPGERVRKERRNASGGSGVRELRRTERLSGAAVSVPRRDEARPGRPGLRDRCVVEVSMVRWFGILACHIIRSPCESSIPHVHRPTACVLYILSGPAIQTLLAKPPVLLLRYIKARTAFTPYSRDPVSNTRDMPGQGYVAGFGGRTAYGVSC